MFTPETFGQWREQRLPWLEQKTAARWIQVWKKFGKALPHNAGVEFSPTVLYLLSAPSTPEPAVTAVTARAEAGEKIDVKAVKAEIEKAKAAEARPLSRQSAYLQSHPTPVKTHASVRVRI